VGADQQPGAASSKAERADIWSNISNSPLHTLSLRKDVVLDGPFRRFMYRIAEYTIRLLPACVIYGGTLCLLICVFFQYRWGVFMSLMLYTFFMCLNSWELALMSGVGLFRCWIAMRNDWYAMYLRELEGPGSPKRNGGGAGSPSHTPTLPGNPDAWEEAQAETLMESEEIREVTWKDVLHVVMLPTYKTPIEVLQLSLRALTSFKDSRTNLGVCLAFEVNEGQEANEKAMALKEEFHDQFRFVTATFHPAGLPGHVPGKSSNECWAFVELRKELKEVHGYGAADPRVLLTIIDDDSELHENYFEALTYHFLKADECARYLTIWQPPIVHFKNFLNQPLLVRTASIFTSLHELACLSNPMDCHVPFSSYSLSLILAASVGGWDPDFISEDWHMMAKCALMTEGRARCKPIFLPLLNYAPEEDGCLRTIKARWTQATRHALGVSEIVYVFTSIFVGTLEVKGMKRKLVYWYRTLPYLMKFCQVHFGVATLAIWPVLSHILINVYMWRDWCEIQNLEDTCETCCVPVAQAQDFGVGQERVILNSWMVYFQRKANAGMAIGLIVAGVTGAIYILLTRDRLDGDTRQVWILNPCLLFLRIQFEVVFTGWISSLMFASLPEWIAVLRIVVTLQFHHVVAGMVGREDNEGDL
jgi:hypothetical protein